MLFIQQRVRGAAMTKNLDALNGWLKHRTWMSGHSLDEVRFYRAVYNVLNENDRNSICPDDIKNHVISRFTGVLEKECLELMAKEATAKFVIISEFCDANNI